MTNTPIRSVVVEDDSSWQQILSEILTDSGLCVQVAGTLEDALKVLKAESHRLAVVDLSLESSDHRNSDGLKVLEAVRRLDPGCQCILLTGYATVELAVSVLTEYGAFSFLRKENFQRAQFRELISQALAVAPQIIEQTETRSPYSTSLSSLERTEVTNNGKKVLVVEDDAGWRGILSELLADGGHQIRLCTSFGDALGALRREPFDLAVVDLSLTGDSGWASSPGTGMEGFQLLAAAKVTCIPTIVVSGVASVDEIQRAYDEHSVFAYLEKQAFDRGTFQRLVQEALAAGHHPSELDALTQREKEVFDLLVKGMSNKEIADTLVISNNTVKRHLKSIFEKLKVHTRAGAIASVRGK